MIEVYDAATRRWYIEEVDDQDTDVVAWAPGPEPYNPPKFGWHPGIDNPPHDGQYLVEYSCPEHDANLYATDRFSGDHGWGLSYRIRFWSHIEPVPSEIPTAR